MVNQNTKYWIYNTYTYKISLYVEHGEYMWSLLIKWAKQETKRNVVRELINEQNGSYYYLSTLCVHDIWGFKQHM